MSVYVLLFLHLCSPVILQKLFKNTLVREKKKGLVQINISNHGHKEGEWCNVALGKDHPKGFFPWLFVSMGCCLCWHRLPAWALCRAGWIPPIQSDQTSLTSAALPRNLQMKVREFHYVHLNKGWGGAKMGLKSKAAEGEVPHSCASLSGGFQFRGADLKLSCVIPNTAGPWEAPFGFTFSEGNPVQMLQAHFVSKMCQMGTVKGFFPKARSWPKLHININALTTISKLTVGIFASGCTFKSRPEFLQDLLNDPH